MIRCVKQIQLPQGLFLEGELYRYTEDEEARLFLGYPDYFLMAHVEFKYLFDAAHRHYQGWCEYVDNKHWRAPIGFMDHNGIHTQEVVFVDGPSPHGTSLMRQGVDYAIEGDMIVFERNIPAAAKVFLQWQECAVDRENDVSNGKRSR